MATVADKVPFGDLCKVLNAPKQRRQEVLRAFIKSWREFHKTLHGDAKVTDSFFPAMRLLLPSFDKERSSYGFKEHMLGVKLREVLGLAKGSPDALLLTNYKAPHGGNAEALGDFGATASEVVGRRAAPSESLSVARLNGLLDDIAQAYVDQDKGAVTAALRSLVKSARGRVGGETEKAEEMKWVIRILLKQMKIGMAEATVLKAFHPEAADLYDATTSLLEVCQKLHSPTAKMDEISVRLGAPFRPMLAARVAPEKIVESMGGAAFYIETKYDGERVQIHKDGDKYRFFSRNGNEFTSSYGADATKGSLTPHLHGLFKESVTNAIIDGEMVGWDTVSQCIASKSGPFDVKHLEDGDEMAVAFVPFDVLLLNDRVLSQAPLKERLSVLKADVFRSFQPGRLLQPAAKIAATLEDLVSALNGAVERREEGIVVKRPDSLYALGKRNAGWFKLKPDYVDALSDDMDLLIVGGYFGKGARANLMSHFLLALAEPVPDGSSEKPSRWVSVCKVGSGYSLAELRQLNAHLNGLPLIRNAGKASVPAWLKLGSEAPDVFVQPAQSKLLQIRSAEITASSGYGIGWTLRFPRVEAIRQDKAWDEAMTTDQFHQARKDRLAAVGARLEMDGDGIAGGTPKKRRAPVSRAIRPTIAANKKAADLSAVAVESSTLKGKELCILTGLEDWPKQAMEVAARQLGATVVQNPGRSTFCCVAGKSTLSVKNHVKSGKYDVATADWLRRLQADASALAWEPRDLLFGRPETLAGLSGDFDAYGDSFRRDADAAQLKATLGHPGLAPGKRPKLDEETATAVRERLAEEGGAFPFAGMTVHVDDEADDALRLAEARLKLGGALVCADKALGGVSHVLIG